MPPKITTSLDEYFWARVDASGDCWEWTAGRNDKGYGIVHLPGTKKSVRAHRLAYELLVGPIPEGLILDHLCRNHGCVNPDHLEPVTHAENLRRSPIVPENALKTHCPNGHPYDEANTTFKVRPEGGLRRHCRACNRERERQRRQQVAA